MLRIIRNKKTNTGYTYAMMSNGGWFENEMKEFGNASIARHKVPRYFIFVNEFPMNAAGKILKYKMREEAVVKYGLQKANSVETA